MNNVLSRLKEIVSAVMYAAEGTELEEVLSRIANVTRELAKTRYAALGIPDGNGGLRYFKTSGMTPEEIAMMEHLPEGHGLIGAIMRERKTIMLDNMAFDKRAAGFPENHPVMTSFLGVPIQIGNQLFGMFYLSDKENGENFTQEDRWLVETMAGYAALAIGGTQLNEQQSQMKLLQERERIGMELHDGVIQSLYAIGMQVDLIRSTSNISPIEMNNVIDGLNEVIEDIRRYILDLRSGKNAKATIKHSIQDIINRLHPPETLKVTLDAPNTYPPFAPAAFEGVCLIVNEALSNAIRHANATQIHAKVWEEGTAFMVRIEDNGHGFKFEDLEKHTGLGLHNMQRRAQIYGGNVQIDSNNGKGTTLTIRIPIGLY